jgi:hypothetical protein
LDHFFIEQTVAVFRKYKRAIDCRWDGIVLHFVLGRILKLIGKQTADQCVKLFTQKHEISDYVSKLFASSSGKHVTNFKVKISTPLCLIMDSTNLDHRPKSNIKINRSHTSKFILFYNLDV